MKAKFSIIAFFVVGALTLSGCAGSLLSGFESDFVQPNNSEISALAVTTENFAHPEQDDSSYEYISSVQATSEGLTLLLRPKGLEKAAGSYSGASQIASWAIDLYHSIGEEFRPYDEIGFLSMPLTKEIYYHALGYKLWPEMRNKINPIKSRFTDYWTNQNQWMWWYN